MGGVVSYVKVKNVGNYILKGMNTDDKTYIVQQLAEENQDIYLPEVNVTGSNQSIVVFNRTPKSLTLRLGETEDHVWVDRNEEVITPTGLSVLSNRAVLLNFLTLEERTSNRRHNKSYINEAFSIGPNGSEPVA